MTMISNKTRKPLSVPLPRGKTLHLGPGRTGEIAAAAVDHPGVKKLVDAGEIEILGESSRATGHAGGGNKGRTSAHGFAPSGPTRSSGDR